MNQVIRLLPSVTFLFLIILSSSVSPDESSMKDDSNCISSGRGTPFLRYGNYDLQDFSDPLAIAENELVKIIIADLDWRVNLSARIMIENKSDKALLIAA